MLRFWCDRVRQAGRTVLAVVLAGAVTAGAAAQPAPVIAGADAPALQQALAQWLEDDEGAALTALAGLATQGNRAAQVLLGVIDKSPALQGPWLSRLPRADRVALMRAPGGLSGRSWLAEAADQPVAAAWLALLRADSGPEVGAQLLALGEARAARQALVTLAAREHPELATAWHDWMDPDLAFVVWHRARPALQDRIAALVPAGHPQRALMGLPGLAADWDDWLAHSPGALPLRSLCAADCPETQASCRRAAMAAMGGPVVALTLGSPVEALIPQDRFLASPRGRAAMRRRILLAADVRGRAALLARATAADACLGSHLTAEIDRYRQVRNGVTEPDG